MIRLLFVAALCFILPCFNAYGTVVQSDRKPVVLSVAVPAGTNAMPGAKIVVEIIADRLQKRSIGLKCRDGWRGRRLRS